MDHHKTDNPFSDHLFEYRTVEKKRLLLSLLITATVMIVEVIGGLITNSIALISDAGHMFTHSFAIAVSLIAIIIARKPPCHHRTFGLYRAEILAAFVNGLFLLLIVITLIYEAILRIIHPLEILAFEMLVVALVGLGVNLLSIFILQGSIKKDLNIKGLFYHIIGDTASSIGIVFAAIVIYFTRWTFIDPLVSLFISLIIAIWAFGILKDSTRILLEMTPKGLNIEIVTKELRDQFPEIKNLYNVHFWTITPEMLVFSAHMKVNNPMSDKDHKQLMSGITKYLRTNYNIIESTIQLSQ
ncbi:MAG: cation transporter [Candidatus Heimdallarchaeota archaeon]|nr:MAG: cation transporter [Candidatus Heimdallarchaeota archaeon]